MGERAVGVAEEGERAVGVADEASRLALPRCC